MFLVKAGTVIQVQTPKSVTHHYWSGWMPYTTSEDKLYDKNEVWDAVAQLRQAEVQRQYELRKNALAKLTEEDRKALGL
jgi:hypothetical protein